jgi:uncharacterized RDD family membrane protein YckC
MRGTLARVPDEVTVSGAKLGGKELQPQTVAWIGNASQGREAEGRDRRRWTRPRVFWRARNGQEPLITCPYCASENSGDEHRCQRCGRRIEPDTASKIFFTREATAPALAAVPKAEPAPPPAAASPNLRLVGNPQRALFPLQQEAGRENRAVLREARREEARPKPRKERVASQTPPRSEVSQQKLEFPAGSPPGPPREMSGHIDCDAMVAGIWARSFALALDIGVILAALGLYASAEKLWLGFIPMGRAGLIALGVAAGTIAVAFKTIWAWCERDSPGQRWMGLRLVSFNGRKPDRRQRMRRALAGVIVSFAGVGLGLAWALVEEEALTFHDLISRTFPAEKD